MEKQLIYENTQAIEAYIKAMQSYIPQWQKAIDECVKVGIKPNITEIDTLSKALQQNSFTEKVGLAYIEDFVREKLADKVAVPEIGGVKISREKFLDMIDLPNCNALTEAVFQLSYSLRQADYKQINTNLYLLSDGKISIPESSIDIIREMPVHRIYAQTEKQMEAYNHALKLVDTLDDLKELGVETTCKCSLIMYDQGVPKVNCLTVSNIQ